MNEIKRPVTQTQYGKRWPFSNATRRSGLWNPINQINRKQAPGLLEPMMSPVLLHQPIDSEIPALQSARKGAMR